MQNQTLKLKVVEVNEDLDLICRTVDEHIPVILDITTFSNTLKCPVRDLIGKVLEITGFPYLIIAKEVKLI